MLNLDDLKPQKVQLELHDQEGNKLGMIPIMPLSKTQWNEVELDLSPPERTESEPVLGGVPKTIDRSKTPEYLREFIAYRDTITLRRTAIALAGGGGFKELKGKSLDEQVEMLYEFDNGHLVAIGEWLAQAALKKSATRFQPIRENGDVDL